MITYPSIKRGIDVIISSGLLVLLIPLFTAIGIMIKLDSKGRVFFQQQRVGKDGKLFVIYKFRSMVADAPSLGAEYTSQNDPRITRMGRWLRITSLDELPQIINVLKGDMSLVGPRPNTPSQEKQYRSDAWSKRHSVRPGITGLAQVAGRSNLTSEEQVTYDIDYIDHLSFAMDWRILYKTIGIALSGRGVN
ncbi:MAG: sugar transferase [Bacteroidota bacterium]